MKFEESRRVKAQEEEEYTEPGIEKKLGESGI